jgi:aminobenzoyl-glutamate transport protein
VERVGNKLPDPAVLFVFALLITWVVSALMDGTPTGIVDKDGVKEVVTNQMTGGAMATFLSKMVGTFTSFPPLGVVLVALLGVGVAERSGFINAALKSLLSFTPKFLLTPMLILVAIMSHTAADAGYVLVIPLGGVIFYAAGRHPLAGIAAAFAGVSGGFSANFIPSALDPMLSNLTKTGAALVEPGIEVNPLCNYTFTAVSSILIVLVGWFITDRIIEPKLKANPVDGDPADMPVVAAVTPQERRAMYWAFISMALCLVLVIAWAAPVASALRLDGELTAAKAPMMLSIVPLIFLLFLLPGIVHGYVAGTFKSHRDVIKAMSKSMETMGYYLVMAFFASLFVYAFGASNLGRLLAVSGAEALKNAGMPGGVTIVGIILLCAFVNLLIGSASAKWGLLAPILVPMLMQLGYSPAFTQAAYRVGDSTTNIITPLMPYFPLVVAFSQKYVKKTGIGTLTSLMLPYSISFLVLWTIFLLLWWQTGIPLGIKGEFAYTMPK